MSFQIWFICQSVNFGAPNVITFTMSVLNRLFFCICFAIFLHQLLLLQSLPPSKNFMKSSQTFNISSSPITWFIYVIANSLNFMKSFKTFNLSSSPITWSHIFYVIANTLNFMKSSKTFNLSSRLTVSALTFVSLSSKMEQVARVKRQTIQWPKEVQS